MKGPVSEVRRRLEAARPLVRPAHNQFEERFLPPYGDPEVYVPGEMGTYVLTGVGATLLTDFLAAADE